MSRIPQSRSLASLDNLSMSNSVQSGFKEMTWTKKNEEMQKKINDSRFQPNNTDQILGVIFIIFGALVFIISTYMFIFSKFFMETTGIWILDWIKEDEYYLCVLPSVAFTTTIFAYITWWQMKLFRHS